SASKCRRLATGFHGFPRLVLIAARRAASPRTPDYWSAPTSPHRSSAASRTTGQFCRHTVQSPGADTLSRLRITMPSEPGRFHPAARHYLQGQPPYAQALIRRVAQLCGVAPTHRVLDLGCGTGQLALAFAPLAGQVLGIDPEPAMLRSARAEAARAGLLIEFR